MKNFALVLLIACLLPLNSSFAAPKTKKNKNFKSFSGVYQGICSLQGSEGPTFYNPLRLTIDAKGSITGTSTKVSYLTTEEEKYDVPLSGRLTNVKKFRTGSKATGVAYGIDGLTLRINLLNANMGIFSGITPEVTAQLDGLLGTCAILKY